MKSILDPGFRYTSSANTDLRKTFRRIRRELDQQKAPKQAPKQVQPEPEPNVASIFRRQRRIVNAD